MKALQQALEDLRTHRQRVESSGPIAPAGVWIEIYRPGGRDVDYARLKAEKAMWGKSRSRGLKGCDRLTIGIGKPAFSDGMPCSKLSGVGEATPEKYRGCFKQ